MNILHICNDFAYSRVHANLYREFDKIGFQQIIFHPLRLAENKGKNEFPFVTLGSSVVYSKILKPHHKLLFESKCLYLYKDLLSKVDTRSIDFSMATTLFSDGYLSYKLFRDFGIPYSVAVRSTDVQVFFKYRPDLIPLGSRVLKHAQKVIFISDSIKKGMERSSLFSFFNKGDLLQDAITLANGIDDFWLDNLYRSTDRDFNKALYIGTFETRKNVNRLLDAMTTVRNRYKNLKLVIVGGGKDESTIQERIADLEWVDFRGRVTDKEQLKEIFRECGYFVMPSYRETFGLVYIEALSQGVPILFSNGQGIDGVFHEKIGTSVNPYNTLSIVNGLEQLIQNREGYLQEIESLEMSRFRWSEIAHIYCKEVFKKEF